MGFDEALDELHAGSLRRFVERRRELVATLRTAGDKEGARRLSAISKPALAPWVVNQLVRRHRAAVDAALSALDRQRDLQLGAITGELDVESLRAAKEAERAAMAAVAHLAGEVLGGDGHAANKANLERVTRLLRAAALDPAARPAFLRGQLTSDASEGGFEAVASQLDPALLLAALTAKTPPPPTKQRKVDGMFARATRSDATNRAGMGPSQRPEAAADPDRNTPLAAPPPAAPAPAPAPAPALAPDPRRERLERLVVAKAAAAQVREDLREQRALLASAEARVVQLEAELATARAQAQKARRQLGDLKVKQDQADKRVRLLQE